jgi:hypothetical protein
VLRFEQIQQNLALMKIQINGNPSTDNVVFSIKPSHLFFAVAFLTWLVWSWYDIIGRAAEFGGYWNAFHKEVASWQAYQRGRPLFLINCIVVHVVTMLSIFLCAYAGVHYLDRHIIPKVKHTFKLIQARFTIHVLRD